MCQVPNSPLFWLWFLTLSTVTFLTLQSQLSMLPFLGWLGFVAFAMKGQETRSGAALTLALVKPHLVILTVALLLWKRQWRTLRAFFAIGGALAFVSVAICGPGVITDYPKFLLESAGWDREKGVFLENMYGWSGFYARTLGGAEPVHWLLTAVSVSATVSLVFWFARKRWAAFSPGFLTAAGVALAGTLLISLHLYRQDLTLVALLLGFGAAYTRRITGRWGWWPFLAAVVWMAQAAGPRLLFEHGVNIQTPAIVLLLAALIITSKRDASLAVPDEETAPLGTRLAA